VTLLAALVLAAPLAGGVLVVPPEPAAGVPPEEAWMGEVVADLLPRALVLAGTPAVDRDDRLRAQQELEIPLVPLTRATSIRVAEALGAARLVVGTYTATAPRASLSLRVLDVEVGSLSAPFVASGSADDVGALVYALAWDIAASGPTPPVLRRDDLVARRPTLSADGLRAYGQALVARNAANKLRYARRAVVAAPSFHPARLLLGRLQLQATHFSDAHETLARVPAAAPEARAARFLQGLALLEIGRYREAASLYAALAVEAPTPAVLNNQALAALRGLPRDGGASALLRRAMEAAPDSADLAFNLGFVLLCEGQGESAAFHLREAVKRDPLDSHARLLLAWAETGAGHPAEAQEAWKAVVSLAPSYASLTTPDLTRRFERLQPAERLLDLARGARTTEEVAAGLVGRADKMRAGGDHEGALRELTRAAYLDPHSARIHVLLARAYRARGVSEQAMGEYQMALWSQDDAAVRAELAELLAEMGRAPEAREQAERALKQDPANAAARKVLGLPTLQ
jgi:tetratricopeptide (TPR) repeat protein